jgi:hypothetical protein
MNKLMKYITESSEIMLEEIYKRDVLNNYTETEEYYLKKFGGGNWREKFELSKPYKYWIECSTSKLYKEELEQVIKLWIDDIILGYDIYMEESINMEEESINMDDEIRTKLIEYRNNYDGTLEYIAKQYDEGYYYTIPNFMWVYDTLN